jgi:serine/threonine protein kinase
VEVLTKVSPSPFLLRCELAFETTTQVFLVTELLGGDDLFFRLDQTVEQGLNGFPEEQARTLLAEISLGLVHLHSRGFLHLDIKVENIMLDACGHVRIVDFGIAQRIPPDSPPLHEIVVGPAGSLIYMAPELLRSGVAGRFTDWWAFGVLAHELLTGMTPWSSLTDERIIKKEIRSCEVRQPPKISQAAGTFVVGLLQRNHKKRLGSVEEREVLDAPFFSGVDWKAIEDGETAPALVPHPSDEVVQPEDSEAILEEYELATEPSTSRSSEKDLFDLGILRSSAAPLR